MRAYVVSLARRPERLAAFLAHFAETGLQRCIDAEPFVAYDGRQLDIDSLRPRISPWNLSHLDDARLRSIVGCGLSHLEVWRLISRQSEPVIVFEDDARLAPGIDSSLVATALESLPHDADCVWLNDYNYGARAGFSFRIRRKLLGLAGVGPRHRRVRFGLMPDVLTTAEAYVITPSYGQQLVKAMENDIGAVDRHIQLFNRKAQGKVYQTEPPLFGQADRSDSDTGGQ